MPPEKQERRTEDWLHKQICRTNILFTQLKANRGKHQGNVTHTYMCWQACTHAHPCDSKRSGVVQVDRHTRRKHKDPSMETNEHMFTLHVLSFWVHLTSIVFCTDVFLSFRPINCQQTSNIPTVIIVCLWMSWRCGLSWAFPVMAGLGVAGEHIPTSQSPE